MCGCLLGALQAARGNHACGPDKREATDGDCDGARLAGHRQHGLVGVYDAVSLSTVNLTSCAFCLPAGTVVSLAT